MAVTLNLSRLNPPIKRYSQNPTACCIHPDLFHMQGYTKTQNKGMEKDLPTKWRAKINK